MMENKKITFSEEIFRMIGGISISMLRKMLRIDIRYY